MAKTTTTHNEEISVYTRRDLAWKGGEKHSNNPQVLCFSRAVPTAHPRQLAADRKAIVKKYFMVIMETNPLAAVNQPGS